MDKSSKANFEKIRDKATEFIGIRMEAGMKENGRKMMSMEKGKCFSGMGQLRLEFGKKAN